MSKIGILSDQKELEQKLTQLFPEERYQLVSFNDKKQFYHIDGLIVNLNNENRLAETINWLLHSKLNPSVFIWILIPELLEQEQDILFKLGANDVFTSYDKLKKRSYVIKNTLSRVQQQETKLTLGKNYSSFLSTTNQSVLINGKEKQLTRNEYKIIHLLFSHFDETLSYEDIFKKIWPTIDYDKEDSNFRISNVIFHLRAKIEESNEFIIKTTRSKGYRLTEK